MKRLVILCLSVLIVQGCGSQATFGDAITVGEPTPIPTAIVPTRPIYEVQRGNIIDQRSYFGRISAVNTSELLFAIEGRVIETFVANGEDVVAGDVLATIDTTELERQLLDAEEELALAQSLLESAENQIAFDRQEAELEIQLAQTFLDFAILQAGDVPSDEAQLLVNQREIELQLAELALAQIDEGVDPTLQFNLTRAEELVEQINGSIEQATLVAPMDGRLVSLLISEGDFVIAFEIIGLVADLSEIEVTDVMENDEMSDLTEGLPLVLQRANSPDASFEGILTQLPQPFGSGGDNQVHVRFNTQPAPDEFTLGERMSFVVTIAEREDVLWLPPGAIRQFSGRSFVVVQDEIVEQRVDVQIGLEGNDRVEILEGLEENQRVIAP